MWINDVSNAIQEIEQSSIQLINKSSDASIYLANIAHHASALRQLMDGIDINNFERKVLNDILARVRKKADIT